MTASLRPINFKHAILCNLDIVATAARTKNWIGKRGLIHAVFDELLPILISVSVAPASGLLFAGMGGGAATHRDHDCGG